MLTKKSPGGLRRRTGMLLTAALSAGLAGLVWAQGGAAPAASQETPPTPPPVIHSDPASSPSEITTYRRISPPVYPASSVRQREEGDVLARVLVDSSGAAKEVLIEKSSGFELLDRAAVDAISQWQFNPGRRGGKPVEGWVMVPIKFSMSGAPDEPVDAPEGEAGVPVLDTIQMRGNHG